MKAVVLVMCKYSVDLQNIQTKILGQQLELRFFFFLRVEIDCLRKEECGED